MNLQALDELRELEPYQSVIDATPTDDITEVGGDNEGDGLAVMKGSGTMSSWRVQQRRPSRVQIRRAKAEERLSRAARRIRRRGVP
ncbi:hypothetical protein S40293_10981 [Stachybotrys chartarum IBT 40293]|nr:hypothetical protein S40293_10981 [Stachybotrys chartarum IBT 40293]